MFVVGVHGSCSWQWFVAGFRGSCSWQVFPALEKKKAQHTTRARVGAVLEHRPTTGLKVVGPGLRQKNRTTELKAVALGLLENFSAP